MDYSRKPPVFSNCKRLVLTCDLCDITFWEKVSSAAKKKRHFCSMKCYSDFRRDYLPKEEQHAYKQGGMPLEAKVLRLKARSDLNHAVQQGKITRECCEVCEDPKSEAHHGDYTKPLEVRWLCKKCHWEEHKLIYENPELLTKEE